MSGLHDELNIESLEFDKQNPRLPTSLKDASDNDILSSTLYKSWTEYKSGVS